MAAKQEESDVKDSMTAGQVEDIYLHSLKHLTQRNYRLFARYLEIFDHEIESIEYTYRDSGFTEVNCQIVRRWLERTTSKAPYLDFIRALEHVGLRRVAEDFKQSCSYIREESGEASVGTSKEAMLQSGVLSSDNNDVVTECQKTYCELEGAEARSTSPSTQGISFSASTQLSDSTTGLKLPSVLCELRNPSKLFTGKAQHKVVKEIGTHYTEHKNNNPGQFPVLVEILQGLGGSGKTEIATNYVFENWKEYSGGVFYICGQSKSSMDFGLRQILQRETGNLEDDANPRTIRQRVLTWLRGRSDWLLFIDDADEPSLVKNLFPVRPKLLNGHIIITSRVRIKWDRWYDVICTPVPHLTDEDSALYLVRAKESDPMNPLAIEYAIRKLEDLKISDNAEYKAVTWLGGVTGLHGLPLALRQAKDYILEFNLSFKEYKEQYDVCRINIFHQSAESDPLEDWLENNDIDAKYVAGLREKVGCDTLRLKTITKEELRSEPIRMDDSDIDGFIDARDETSRETFAFMLDPSKDNFLTTWRLNYERICCDDAAREFLQLCSCLWYNINTSLFTAGAKFMNPCKLKTYLLGDSMDEQEANGSTVETCRKVRDLIHLLHQFSFVTKVVGESQMDCPEHDLSRFGTFIIHHLVQQVVFLRLITQTENKVRSVNNVMRILSGLFPSLEEVVSDNFEGLYDDKMRDRHSIIAIHTQALATQVETLGHDDIVELENTNRLFTAVGAYLRRLDRANDARILYRLMVRLSRWRKPLNEEYLADGM